MGYKLQRINKTYQYPEQAITDYAEFVITRQEATDILKAVTNTYEVVKKWDKQLDSAQKLRARDFTCDRNMMVIYTTGGAGSGKSKFGKWYAIKKGYTHTISAGGDHPFDAYDCEDALLLQDFRASVMRLNDFLKLTDNYQNSQVGARYNNKNFSHCKLIMIDSVLMPDALYKAFQNDVDSEPITQWYRRIDWKFIKIEDEKYNLYYIDKDTLKYHFAKTLITVAQVDKDLNIDKSKKANTLEADFGIPEELQRIEEKAKADVKKDTMIPVRNADRFW